MGFFYNGGGERTVLNQAHGLKNLGYEVQVYAPTISLECFPELQKGIEMIELNKWLPKDLPMRASLGMIISSLNIPYKEIIDNDVIISHAQPSNWIAYAVNKKYQIPYIAYLHQVNRFFKPRDIDKKVGWSTNKDIALLDLLHKGNIFIKKLDDISIKNADLIFTNSKWIREQIKSYYNSDSLVCYPGVDVNKFRYSCTNKKRKYILSTNRHYPQKRIDYIIKCMKYLVPQFDDVKCIITGGFTNHTMELIKLRDELGLKDRVIFTGNINNNKLIKLYKNAYIYAYTSPEEDFGLGPIESGACGTPSVVWDHAGPRETVIDGVTGYRIEPYNLEDMVEHHKLLLEKEDLRNTLGKNASEHVKEKFTWEKHCEKIHEHIQLLV